MESVLLSEQECLYEVNSEGTENNFTNYSENAEKSQEFSIWNEFANDEKLVKLLHSFKDIFSKNERDIGQVSDFECNIKVLPNALPIRARPYPLNPGLRTVQENEIKKLLDCGLIMPSTSIFSSPICLLRNARLLTMQSRKIEW